MNRCMSLAWLLIGALCAAGCSSAPIQQDPRFGPHADAKLGPAKIEQYGCGSCHTIPGVPGARGHVGPPLTQFSRRTYIAGLLPNTPQNVETWVMHPHSVRQPDAMPEMGVTEPDAAAIAAYLYTLR